MSDWREMVAGREFDRLIAERLGWTNIREREYYEEAAETGGWRLGWVGTAPDGDTFRQVPEYSTNANVALILLPLNGAWEISTENDLYYVTFTVSNGLVSSAAPTVALAICKSWMELQGFMDNEARRQNRKRGMDAINKGES